MERQIIKDLDGNAPRPRIRHCSICDPFIMIIREDESLGLFIGESERGKIRRKDMSPMGEKVRELHPTQSVLMYDIRRRNILLDVSSLIHLDYFKPSSTRPLQLQIKT